MSLVPCEVPRTTFDLWVGGVLVLSLRPGSAVWRGAWKYILKKSPAKNFVAVWCCTPTSTAIASLSDFVFPKAVHTTRSSNAVQYPSPRRASDPPRGRMTGSGQPAPLQGLQGATDEVLPRTPHRSPPTSSPKKPPANTRKNSRVMAVRFLTAGVRVYDHDGGRAS